MHVRIANLGIATHWKIVKHHVGTVEPALEAMRQDKYAQRTQLIVIENQEQCPSSAPVHLEREGDQSSYQSDGSHPGDLNSSSGVGRCARRGSGRSVLNSVGGSSSRGGRHPGAGRHHLALSRLDGLTGRRTGRADNCGGRGRSRGGGHRGTSLSGRHRVDTGFASSSADGADRSSSQLADSPRDSLTVRLSLLSGRSGRTIGSSDLIIREGTGWISQRIRITTAFP